MPRCPACNTPAPEGAAFCPSCGAAVRPTQPGSLQDDVTAEVPPSRGATPTPQLHSTPSPATTPGLHSAGTRTGHTSTVFGAGALAERFAPGQVLLGRYRIAGKLGKGGMGEVYRADDLTLGQPVALKFLPPGVSSDPDRVQRLVSEVRLTRQISHPNVCRVYDIVELVETPGAAPTLFLAMEFIDGEDLASLLRRIGRLPRDKGIELGRQICAGLAAAHELGVIHRDIKPSNIMIDGRGRARIADFGVASAVLDPSTSRTGTVALGTPAYMAPEQFLGDPPSPRADIYSLGLVLYEMFTGKPALKASSIEELRRLHEQSAPPSPSTLVDDMDPAVERTIMRCLERRPEDRPVSALAVSASLPGGDPLAAALAAGETPSPELIAASGATGLISARVAVACILAVLVMFVGVVLVKQRFALLAKAPFELSREVLRSKAVDALKAAGVTEKPEERVDGFFENSNVQLELAQTPDRAAREALLKEGRRPAILYWYRQSPDHISPVTIEAGRPAAFNPAMEFEGEARVLSDSSGRLLRLETLAPQSRRDPDPRAPRPIIPASEADWSPLMRAADIDPARLTKAEPTWVSEVRSDSRIAWTGVLPAPEPIHEVPIRVEAATLEGKIASFRVIGPWTVVGSAGRNEVTAVGQVFDSFSFFFMLSIGPIMAWRHAHSGRGDRRGAWRVGLFVTICAWLAILLMTASTGSLLMASNFREPLAAALWRGAFSWMLYMALEPYIRRTCPEAIISWTRLISGRYRDPLVGRDILLGCVLAAVVLLINHLSAFLPELFHRPPVSPLVPQWIWLAGPSAVAATFVEKLGRAVLIPMYVTLLLVGLKLILRKDVLAYIALGIIGAFILTLDSTVGQYVLVVTSLAAAAYLLALVRYGILALAAMFFTIQVIAAQPITADMGTWYAPVWLTAFAVILALTAWAAWTAMGGRQAFRFAEKL